MGTKKPEDRDGAWPPAGIRTKNQKAIRFPAGIPSFLLVSTVYFPKQISLFCSSVQLVKYSHPSSPASSIELLNPLFPVAGSHVHIALISYCLESSGGALSIKIAQAAEWAKLTLTIMPWKMSQPDHLLLFFDISFKIPRILLHELSCLFSSSHWSFFFFFTFPSF